MALAGAGSALAADSAAQSSSTPRALTKNQRIALIALDAHKAAVKRFGIFFSQKAAVRNTLKNRIQCVVDRIGDSGIYFSNLSGLPNETQVAVALASQLGGWYGYLYKAMPKKGRFSARATKEIYLAAASRARKLNPDITGERIIRGLRAQADRIDVYRKFPRIRACAVLDDWGTNGYDLDRLAPLIDAFTVMGLLVQASDYQSRLSLAVNTMTTIPGIQSSEAQGFGNELIDDAFETIASTILP